MPNWVILLVCILAISYGMMHGLLMLISPRKHRKFNLKVSDPFHMLKRESTSHETDRGLELGYRFAGFAIVVMCILIAWGSLGSLLGHSPSTPKHAPTQIAIPFNDWWQFVAAVGFLLFGLYAFLRPLHLYQWTAKRAFPGVIPPESGQISKGGRFLGVCFMILGVISLWLALR